MGTANAASGQETNMGAKGEGAKGEGAKRCQEPFIDTREGFWYC